MTNYNEDKTDYEKQVVQRDTNRPERRRRHKYTKFSASIRLCLSVLGNSQAVFNARFIKRLSNTEKRYC